MAKTKLIKVDNHERHFQCVECWERFVRSVRGKKPKVLVPRITCCNCSGAAHSTDDTGTEGETVGVD